MTLPHAFVREHPKRAFLPSPSALASITAAVEVTRRGRCHPSIERPSRSGYSRKLVRLRRGNRLRLRSSLVTRGCSVALTLVIAAVVVAATSGALRRSVAEPGPPGSPPISIPVRFTDVARAAGINFKQDATATDQKYYLETMGTGLGWIDYDQDGLMDLYLVQSAATDIYKPPQPLRSALYHNNGDGTFTDVTEKAGVGAAGLYGQG